MVRAQQFTDVCTFHGEGPVWDAQRDALFLVDMLAGAIVEVRDATVVRHEVSKVVAALRRRRSGGFVVALERSLALLDDDFAIVERLGEVVDPGARFNEGGCDPTGRFYIGSMAYDQHPGGGTLFRLEADRSLHTAVTPVTISNGIQWSGDGTHAFYNDTANGRVDVFDADATTGRLSNRRPYAVIDGPGGPDGMAIDEEGGLWVALWEGGAVVRIDADGSVSERVELPVPLVTSCAFGGDDGRDLYITTSRDGAPDEALASSGAVFLHRPGVAGAVVHDYAG